MFHTAMPLNKNTKLPQQYNDVECHTVVILDVLSSMSNFSIKLRTKFTIGMKD